MDLEELKSVTNTRSHCHNFLQILLTHSEEPLLELDAALFQHKTT